MKDKTGIIGGTFDPVHFGHLRAAEETAENLGLSKVVFVPAHVQPLKEEGGTATAAERLAMVELAIGDNPRFRVDDCEIKRGGSSYTVETLQYFNGKFPDSELFFLMGADSWLSITKWHKYERLFELAWMTVLTRPGHESKAPEDVLPASLLDKLERDGARYKMEGGRGLVFLPITPLDISGTAIRELRHSGASIKYLVPSAVEKYIVDRRLYSVLRQDG